MECDPHSPTHAHARDRGDHSTPVHDTRGDEAGARIDDSDLSQRRANGVENARGFNECSTACCISDDARDHDHDGGERKETERATDAIVIPPRWIGGVEDANALDEER